MLEGSRGLKYPTYPKSLTKRLTRRRFVSLCRVLSLLCVYGVVCRYEDVDVIKVLCLFEERITAMKEAVAMDMNEKLDTAGNTVSSTKMLQTGKASPQTLP